MVEKIRKTEKQWSSQLPTLAYQVTRRGKTERPFTNDNFPKAPGTFSCVCCASQLFDAQSKFDSGTGWPSFFEPIDDSVIDTKADYSMFRRRTEVLCSRCDAHLGHVFKDGPEPTGLRYCINGVALSFEPDEIA